MARPPEAKARKAVDDFFEMLFAEEAPPFTLIEDGEDSWAFFILESDTTSYVHNDLKVEWYGTSHVPGEDDIALCDHGEAEGCPECMQAYHDMRADDRRNYECRG